MGKKMTDLLLFGLGCLLVLWSGTGEAAIGNIKEFLNTCPKNDPAYNQIKSDFTIRHNGFIVPMDGLACDEPTSTMNIAQYTVELIVLQGLRTIYYMDYGQSGHLPWTPGTMYQWMKSKIKGFNIDDTATYNSCCDGSFPGGPYVTLTKSDDFNRDFDRAWKGIAGNIGLYAHEVRHLDGPGHVNCNGSANDWDYNPANISSFGTQWWLEKSWLNGEINVGYACLSSAEKQDIAAWHLTSANMFRDRFCNIQPPLLTAPSNPAGPCLEAQALPWKIITVDSALDYGQYAAIAIDPRNNIPYISYYNAANHHLRLANPVTTGGNCGPGSSWFCQTVDSNPNVGKYSSIGISPPGLSRELGISYVDDANHTLKYYYDYCFLGTCHQVIETVDSGLNPITSTSLKFDSNGIPHIAYLGSCGANCSRLKYAKWVGSGGTCGTGNHWKCDQVDAASNANYPSLDLDKSNLPRIAYYDAQAGDLRYAWKCGTDITCAHNCGPANDWGCDTLDSTGTVGLFPSLYIDKAVSNNPRIAYYDSAGKLKYASIPGGGTLGNCGPLFLGIHYWQCDSIANMGSGLSGNLGISLSLDPAGKPLIAYMDASEAQAPAGLWVARPVSAPGLGNCGPLYGWECNPVDGGGSWTNEGSFAALAFNSKGKPIVAYYEEDNYTDGNLKVATLWDQLFLPLILKNP